jgi:outer membrane immunogenic protein
MRPLAILLVSAVAFAGVNADAHAADRLVTKAPIVKAPPPAPAPAGTGFYIGVNAGYSWSGGFYSDPVSGIGFDIPTGMAGLTFGYNAQSGAFVYGLETDFNGAWNKGTNGAGPPCLGCETGLVYFGTLRGRLGYAVGQALPYVTGGLAYGAVRTGLPGFSKDTDVKAGWTVGGGVEYALGGSWSVKAEYLYFDLGRAGCDFGSCGAPPIGVEVHGNLLRGGVNYRF